jgi:RNase P subunit RPR2
MKLIKEIVCASCHSLAIVDKDCICVWENKYPTIELEFEQCECCGHVSEYPADTEFNMKQLQEENFEEDLDDVEDH